MRVRLVPDSPPQRCDRALVEALQRAGHSCTRSQLARAFEAGQVTAEGRRLKPSARLETPAWVEVTLPRPEPLRAEPEALCYEGCLLQATLVDPATVLREE